MCSYTTELEESVDGGPSIKPDVRFQICLSVLVPKEEGLCLFCANIDVYLSVGVWRGGCCYKVRCPTSDMLYSRMVNKREVVLI